MTSEGSYTVGRRYLNTKNGQPVTLRYIGPLPPPGAAGPSSGASDVWLGVEYDDAGKGKHSGTYEGRQVFEVEQAGAGAFVKLRGRPLDAGPTFGEAVAQRYGVAVDASIQGQPAAASSGSPVAGTPSTVRLGDTAIVADAPGLDRVHARIGQLERTREMGLDGMRVRGLGHGDNEFCRSRLQGLQRLDLSRNLLCSWADVAAIANELEGLRVLLLNGSRLGLVRPGSAVIPHVTELHLGDSGVTWDEARRIVTLFPSLRTLFLQSNPISTCTGGLTGVTSLSIAGCPIADWASVVNGPGSSSDLAHLDLTATPLASVPAPPTPHATGERFAGLTSLTWFASRIGWADMDALALWTAGRLTHLRFSTDTADEGTTSRPDAMSGDGARDRPGLVARLPGLQVLNGTEITTAERRDAELAYIAQAERSGDAGAWPRYVELARLHRPTLPADDANTAAAPARGSKPGGTTLASRMIIHAGADTFDVRVLPSMQLAGLQRKIEKKAGSPGVLRDAVLTEAGQWQAVDDEIVYPGEIGWWAHDGDHVIFDGSPS